MKPKNQRLALILLALGAVGGAVLLAMSALSAQAAFFYSPGDVVRHGRPPADRAVRVGGMVRRGSIRRHADGITIDFLVGDETPHTIRVRYRGITPDLFRENSGVVAEGRFQAGGLFVASEILAKHDENYMPVQIAGEKHKSGSLE